MIEETTPFFFTKVVAEADIDMLNHVNNAVYLQYLQEAAIAHWESRASTDLQNEVSWIVRRHEIDYLKAAVLGDSLQIKTWVGAYTAATWDRHYEIYHKVNQQLLVKAKSVWVAVDRRSMRVRRIEGSLKDCFFEKPSE
ncbi:acyl-CoA thioesterase [Runella zeae]|uniref:acyl-CoA thioesterase n=1 Tax=Runella zeae TaxID=94255 RepID=UPI002353E722|nr:thioesterase family protein [Runella zeae]